MIYHPFASFLVEVIEQKSIRYSKDINELNFIQSSVGTAERFAAISVSTFAKSVKQSIAKAFKGTLFTTTTLGKVEEEKFGTATGKLLFNPIDSYTNLCRGFPQFGCSILFQEQTKNGMENIFSLVYLFQTQEIIYSDSLSSYNKGRPIKTVLRKNPKIAIASCNTACLKESPDVIQKFMHVQSSGSIISDIHSISKGKIDAIIFEKAPLLQILPIEMLAKALRLSNNPLPFTEISSKLDGEFLDVFYSNKPLQEELTKKPTTSISLNIQ
jgi:fructose-1,6-bisphosphatase/inositol monophosphatase family enzyme